MKYRMAAAILSLIGVLVAAYLYLYKIGAIGTLACGTGGCETVQLSPWSRFLGIEVALIGLLGYLVMLGVALAGTTARFAAARWPDTVLLALSAGALAFTLYLTALELFVIHAICRWCVGSAVIVLLLFIVAVLGFRHRMSPAA